MTPAQRLLSALLLLSFLIGCTSSANDNPNSAAAAPSPGERDAGALADLELSEKWSSPRCRWLKTGAWVLAYPGETALYRAAYQVGYIEMEEVGQDNRHGTPEPAWKIKLTELGKAETAECKASSSDSWGVPVSRRRLLSGTYVGEEPSPSNRFIYEVEYQWVPTTVGEDARHALTGTQAVEEGTYRTRVYLRRGPRLTSPGPNGWWVDAIDDLDAQRLR